VLDLTLKELEKVLYFESWIVMDPGKTPLKKMELLTEEEVEELKQQYGTETFKVGIGAEAIRSLLEEVDLDKVESGIAGGIENLRI